MPQTEEEFLAGADATPAPEPAASPEPEPAAEEPETKAEPEAKAEDAKAEPDAEKPKQTPWFQKRIDDLTREKWDERRAREALQQERDNYRQALEKLRNPEGQPAAQADQQPKGMTQADFDKAVADRAAQLAQQRAFDESCNKVFEEGSKSFPDFQDALSNFKLLGGLPPVLIEAAIETDNAANVLYQLGKNPGEADRILRMSPTKMAVAVAKLASKPAEPLSVSKAPPPIKPIAGNGKVETDPEKMPVEQWMKWDEERQAKRRA